MYLSVMTKDAVQGLQTQIPPVSLAFDAIEKLYALYVVKKVSDVVVMTKSGQIAFAVMAEWGVSDVMSQGDGLDEVLVQP